MKKLKNEKKMKQKTQTMDKGSNTDSINMEKPNVVIKEVFSVEEIPKVEFKKQFIDKETYIDLVMVDVPLTIIDVTICQPNIVVSPANKKISILIMTTQPNHDNIKPKIRMINLLGYHINTQIK
jgi:hypothetical protein